MDWTTYVPDWGIMRTKRVMADSLDCCLNIGTWAKSSDKKASRTAV